MRLARLLAVGAGIFSIVFEASSVSAESWHARVERMPGAKSYCVDVPLVFDFSTDGGQLTGKFVKPRGGDVQFGSSIGPDGGVRATFTVQGAGNFLVTGNALTRDLRLGGLALRDCNYALAPVPEGPGAFAQWKASMQQISGNTTTCKPPDRASVTTIGDALFYYEPWRLGPVFALKTATDGSADVDTQTAYGFTSMARVKVAAGSGPRILQFVTFTNVCGYKVIPD